MLGAVRIEQGVRSPASVSMRDASSGHTQQLCQTIANRQRQRTDNVAINYSRPSFFEDVFCWVIKVLDIMLFSQAGTHFLAQ